uniref:Membrane glycoprotein E51 n=1 Tax=Elephant endotheliotropic herpesvirus 1A TaxID=759753 RepID=A0A1L3HP61_ELHV1|nr:membrane glycoprotein E51 [Elephant endotheliotropic herpesvirus 1A]
MMGGGCFETSIVTYIIFMGNFFYVFVLCANPDLCQSSKKNFTTSTISRSNDQITITVKIETDDYYVLKRNSSILYTKTNQPSDVTINATHFILVTSCATATGNYSLQTASHNHGSTCHYFNVSCPSYFTSTPLAQSSCSECNYTTFTTTPFVILIFYLIFLIF